MLVYSNIESLNERGERGGGTHLESHAICNGRKNGGREYIFPVRGAPCPGKESGGFSVMKLFCSKMKEILMIFFIASCCCKEREALVPGKRVCGDKIWGRAYTVASQDCPVGKRGSYGMLQVSAASEEDERPEFTFFTRAGRPLFRGFGYVEKIWGRIYFPASKIAPWKRETLLPGCWKAPAFVKVSGLPPIL